MATKTAQAPVKAGGMKDAILVKQKEPEPEVKAALSKMESEQTRADKFRIRASELIGMCKKVGMKEEDVRELEEVGADLAEKIEKSGQSWFATTFAKRSFTKALEDKLSVDYSEAKRKAMLLKAADHSFAPLFHAFLQSRSFHKETQFHYDSKTGQLEYAVGPRGELAFFDETGKVTIASAWRHGSGDRCQQRYVEDKIVVARNERRIAYEFDKNNYNPLAYHFKAGAPRFHGSAREVLWKDGKLVEYHRAFGTYGASIQNLNVKIGKAKNDATITEEDAVIKVRKNPNDALITKSSVLSRNVYRPGDPDYERAYDRALSQIRGFELRMERMQNHVIEVDRFVQEVQAKVKEGEVPLTKKEG